MWAADQRLVPHAADDALSAVSNKTCSFHAHQVDLLQMKLSPSAKDASVKD
jgi:hypothetical protein